MDLKLFVITLFIGPFIVTAALFYAGLILRGQKLPLIIIGILYVAFSVIVPIVIGYVYLVQHDMQEQIVYMAILLLFSRFLELCPAGIGKVFQEFWHLK